MEEDPEPIYFWVPRRVATPPPPDDTEKEMHPAFKECLASSIIMQNILGHTSKVPLQERKWRLVSKSFNKQFLIWAKRTHKSITLTANWSYTTVNSFSKKLQSLPNLFKYLNEVVNVRVEEFRLGKVTGTEYDRIEVRDEQLQMQLEQILGLRCDKVRLHYIILKLLLKDQNLKTFVGMGKICPSVCAECKKHALQCSVYGELTLRLLMNAYTRPHHYEKLFITDKLIHEIADMSIEGSTSREECFAKMQSLITPKITVSHLRFTANIFAEIDQMSGTLKPAEALPRELIMHLCRTWKVQSIKLVFKQCTLHKPRWMSNTHYSQFSWSSPFYEVPRTKTLHFDHVKIDIDAAYSISKDIVEGIVHGGKSYSNLLANVRRVFPTNKIQFHGSVSREYIEDEEFLQLLKFCWKEGDEKQLKITLRHFVTKKYERNDFEFVDWFEFYNRTLTCTELDTKLPDRKSSQISKELVGKLIRISDTDADCSINLEIYAPEKFDYHGVMEEMPFRERAYQLSHYGHRYAPYLRNSYGPPSNLGAFRDYSS